MAKSRHYIGETQSQNHKALATRTASVSDRAVIIAFGAVFGSVPWIFTGIAHAHSGHASIPIPLWIGFELISLLFIVGGLSRNLRVTSNNSRGQ